MSNPWLKFYPSDWRSDPVLRMCSIGARGFWIEMLCLMHEASPYGSLRVNGKSITPRQLAVLVGCAADEATTYLTELEEAGAFSRDEDGTIFSRRMRRDAEKAARDKANGRLGGNPGLKNEDKSAVNGGVNPLNNPTDNREDKAQKPEARGQKLEHKGSVSFASNEATETAEPDRPQSADEAEANPEQWFWNQAKILEARGVVRSRLGNLVQLHGGNWRSLVPAMRQILAAREPSPFLGAIIADLRRDVEAASPRQAAPPSRATRRGAEPDFVRNARAEGQAITAGKRKNGEPCWRIATTTYDALGNEIGF